MSLYAVVGNPVEHSKSPQIHHLFAEQAGLDLEYLAIKVEAGGFAAFVSKFFVDGGKGLNVTVPFKEAAFELADHYAPGAALAKSVNTLFIGDEETLHGDNTDGIGLVNDLQQNNSVSIQGNRILMLGAGGAIRGALAELVNHQPASITILNRTLSKAEQLANEFGGLIDMRARDYGSFDETEFDLIINGTSLSLTGELPELEKSVMAENACCYDMMYGIEDTVFVAWAKQNGTALALDGLGMLVEQAAVSFSIWHGVHPDTAPVIAALRS